MFLALGVPFVELPAFGVVILVLLLLIGVAGRLAVDSPQGGSIVAGTVAAEGSAGADASGANGGTPEAVATSAAYFIALAAYS